MTTITESLNKAGHKVTIIPDLCAKVMQKEKDLTEIGERTILVCYPRAIRNHFKWLELKVDKITDIRNSNLT